MLTDIQQYKPAWVMGGASTGPKELDFISSTAGEWEDELDKLVNLDAMHCTKSVLGNMTLPPNAHFVPGKVVYV